MGGSVYQKRHTGHILYTAATNVRRKLKAPEVFLVIGGAAPQASSSHPSRSVHGNTRQKKLKTVFVPKTSRKHFSPADLEGDLHSAV